MARNRRVGDAKNKRPKRDLTAKKGPGALKKTAAAVAAFGAGYAIGTAAIKGVDAYRYHNNAEYFLKRNPGIVRLMESPNAGRFNNLDKSLITNHPKLKPYAGRILPHWESIVRIAGNKYNTLAVLDTLTRIRNASGELAQFTGNIGPRQQRRRDILERSLRVPDHDAMMRDLFKVPSYNVERLREMFYGKDRSSNWRYGRPKALAKLPHNMKKNGIYRPDAKSGVIGAKGLKGHKSRAITTKRLR